MDISRRDRWLRLAPGSVSSAAKVPLDDEALIEAVVSGDTRHAGELHDRLVRVVDGTLQRLLGPSPDIDDLVQATFEQLVVSLVRGRFARGCSLSTWASSVAAHVAFNAMRARRRARRVFDPASLLDVSEPRASGNPEREVAVREQIAAVQVHLAAMSPERAMALLLHDVLGHDLVEMAAMLKISATAAQSRLVRGRRELLRKLGEEDGSKGTRP
ncbi:MAG: RNA polymerase sigma factor [Myxococcota bacterium]|nr:RNA polymerase sigma factor [Myxococcota bacterium]